MNSFRLTAVNSQNLLVPTFGITSSTFAMFTLARMKQKEISVTP